MHTIIIKLKSTIHIVQSELLASLLSYVIENKTPLIIMIRKIIIYFYLYMYLAVQGEVLHIVPSVNSHCTKIPCLTLSEVAKRLRIDLEPTAESVVQLLFLPGDHSLNSDIDISNIEGFSMISSFSFQVNITCQRNKHFIFHKIGQIAIKGLTFLGCGNNKIVSSHQLKIKNTHFFGSNASGTALELIDTNAKIINCSFAFNTHGNLRGPIQVLKFWQKKFKRLNVSVHVYVGGAIIANHSTAIIVGSIFWNNSAEVGGAIFATSGSNITILNSSFNGNSAIHRVNSCTMTYCQIGGALYTENSTIYRSTNVIIFGSEFSKNTAAYGGAISTFNCSLNATSSRFCNNSAISNGGVLYALVRSKVHIRNCEFWKNEAVYFSAVIDLYFFSTMTIDMSHFYENRARSYAGVLYVERWSVVSISKSLFNANHASSGGAMIVREWSSVMVHDTKFCNNTAVEHGGAIVLVSANMTLFRSLLCNNSGRNYGGAIDTSINSSLIVYNCEFRNNFAVKMGGGAINAGYTNGVKIIGSLFVSNTAALFASTHSEGIGGALLVSSTSIIIDNSSFLKNGVQAAGGAIAATQSQVHFRNKCTLLHNTASYGGAIYAIDSTLHIEKNVIIMLNSASAFGGGALLQYSKLICQYDAILTVINNTASTKGGGIYATNSRITVLFYRGSLDSIKDSGVYFTNNSARLGGGVYLELASELFIENKGLCYLCGRARCNFCFFSNHADLGGAIYVADETNYEICTSTSKWGHYCFLQSLSPIQSKCTIGTNECNYVSVRFEKNTAIDSGGSVLYGGLLDRCINRPGNELQIQKKNKTTGEMKVILANGLPSFKILSKIVNVSNSEVDTVISSSPVRVCYCKPDGQADCKYKPPPIAVKKGFNFSVSIVAVDQVNHTMGNVSIYSSLRYAQSGLGDGQLIQMTKRTYCSNLTFSISSPHNFEFLTLYAEGPCRNASNSSLLVDIKFSPCACPIGFQPRVSEVTNCVCECDSNLPKYITDCDSQYHTLLRDSNFWITFLTMSDTDKSSGYLSYPYCPFDYCRLPDSSTSIDLNVANGADAQCANNRSGILCGVCKPGFSLSLGSSRCIQCTKTWRTDLAVLLAVSLLSGVLVVALILVLNLTVAIGTLNGILFYANVIDPNSSMYFSSSSTKFLSVFISWLNLEIGLDVCFYDSMDTYWKTWLQLAFPMYVISLVFAIIFLSRKSITFSMLISKKNPVATLATLVLLSYSKLLRMIISVLSMAKLKFPNGSFESVWLPDATIKYLQGGHISLFIAATVILILGAAYTFLILFWQWLLKWVKYQKLCHFLEPYHAPYILKHRYWTGLLLLVRIAIYLAISLNGSGDPSMNLLVIIVATSGLLFLKGQIGQIYKSKKIDVIETICYLNLLLLSAAKLFTRETRNDHVISSFVSGLITLILFLYVLAYHAFTELCLKQCRKFKQNRQKPTETEEVSDNINYQPVNEDKLKPTFSTVDGLPRVSNTESSKNMESQECSNLHSTEEFEDEDNASTISVDSMTPLIGK